MVATTFRGGHPIAGRRAGLHPRNCRQLAVVGVSAFRNDDGISVRALVAALGTDDRRAVRRNALFRKARGISARLSRGLSRPDDELPDSRLGNQGDDRHRRHHAGPDDQPWHVVEHVRAPDRHFRAGVFRNRRPRADRLHFLPDSVYRACTFRWADSGACCGRTCFSSY